MCFMHFIFVKYNFASFIYFKYNELNKSLWLYIKKGVFQKMENKEYTI